MKRNKLLEPQEYIFVVFETFKYLKQAPIFWEQPQDEIEYHEDYFKAGKLNEAILLVRYKKGGYNEKN